MASSEWRQHLGLVRSRQEDAWRASDYHGCWVIADGMGGHAAGDVAAEVAAQTAFASVLCSRDGSLGSVAAHAALAAHRAVLRESSGRRKGLGSTLAMLLVRNGEGVICHTGDSRIYRFSPDGLMTQMTTDHATPTGHLIRALGHAGGDAPEVRQVDPQQGSLWLLCSDGLTRAVSDRDIATILGSRDTLASKADGLIHKALDAGGPDNVTAILVRP